MKSRSCDGWPPNGERYPLVGGTRQRRFAGINLKPRKRLENAQTPTSRVHTVLGGDPCMKPYNLTAWPFTYCFRRIHHQCNNEQPLQEPTDRNSFNESRNGTLGGYSDSGQPA